VAQNPSGGTATLKLRILFTKPIDEVALNGYAFGLVAKQRTPEDRKDFEDLWIKRGLENQNQARFRVFLEQPADPDATPVIHFRLLDKDGHEIQPDIEPTSFDAGKDLLEAVALAQDGQLLTFPIVRDNVPLITTKMTTLKLSVLMGNNSKELVFRLQ
jgi:hypothetical protein